jgi:uncharacterized lipoprotein YddW (UPF0748 family)
MRTSLFSIILLILASALTASAAGPKHEFRGAWMHTVYQEQYSRQSTDANKKYLRDQLDKLKAAGVNAVIFQVRPSADAFYPSTLEPWSRFLSGKAGKAPAPLWDPLQFMIDEAHARGMELHAWLNPYRVTTSKNEVLPKGHIALREPGRVVKYADGKIYFDPGRPENRRFIAGVVGDIVRRYDVDGIHFDDYFYPYPAGKAQFPDDASYRKYGNGLKRDDWRRRNVDLLIEEVHDTIRADKPWVRFGISPFGIWRNKTSDPKGSATNGLENYDALYADVLLWAEKGWIDYLMPQVYWPLDHKAAAYRVLTPWWDSMTPENCHLYIGQDVERTMNADELIPKLELMASGERTKGLCWWPAYSVTSDFGGIARRLADTALHGTPALVPPYPWLSHKAPSGVRNLHHDRGTLRWSAPAPKGKADDAVRFVVYRFDSAREADISRADAIAGVTSGAHFDVPGPGAYVVTALSRVNNESKPSEIIIVK